MKKLFLINLLSVFLYPFLTGQSIEPCFGNRICVKNDTKDKLLFHLSYQGENEKFYLLPSTEKDIMLTKISRTSIDELTVTVLYDSSSYSYELKDIREEANDRKFKEGIYAAFFTAVDQFFFLGKIGDVLTKLEIATKIVEGKSVGEWGEDFVKSTIESKFIDDIDSHIGKTLAAVGFKIFEIMTQGQYPDLAERTKYAMQKLKKGEIKTIKGSTMEYSLYPFSGFNLSIGYQIRSDFTYSKVEDLEYYKGTVPFSIELKYFISRRAKILDLEDDAIQFTFSFGVNNSPIFYKASRDSIFSSDKAYSLLNLQPSLGLKVNLGTSSELKLGGELQVGYNLGTRFLYNYQTANNTAFQFDKNSTNLFSNNQVFISLGVSANMNIGNLFAEITSYGIGGDNALGGTYMTVGVGLPLMSQFNFSKPERSGLSWSKYY